MSVRQSDSRSDHSFYFALFVLQGYDLYQHFDRIMSKKMSQIVSCVPAKLKGMHGCTGSGKSVLGLVLPVMKHVVGKEIRLRFHLHVSNERLFGRILY